MLQSILVYGFMILIMYICGKIALLYPRYKYIFLLLSISVFVLFSGLRYDVGVDYMTYRDVFKSFSNDYSNTYLALYEHSRYEIGFLGIVLLCAKIGFSPCAIFALFALIQILCVFYVFKDNRKILPYIGLTLIAGGGFFIWMNAMRQITAFTLFLVSSKMLYKKRYVMTVLFALFALSMHKSAVLFLPFLILTPLFQKRLLSIKLQLIIFFASIFLSNLQVWNYFSNVITSILSIMGDFGERYSSDSILEVNNDLDFGIRAAIVIVLNLISILFSHRLSNMNQPYYNYIYNIFFIGVVMSHLFADNHYLTRFTLYFSSMSFIVYSYLLSYLSRYKKGYNILVHILFVSLLLLYLFRTIQADDGTASILYQFCFI